jgi:hypothetical protein
VKLISCFELGSHEKFIDSGTLILSNDYITALIHCTTSLASYKKSRDNIPKVLIYNGVISAAHQARRSRSVHSGYLYPARWAS